MVEQDRPDERPQVPGEHAERAPHASVSDQARVGIVGDYGTIGQFTAVTSRREVTWPVVVGSPPPVASAFQDREALVGLSAGGAGTVVLGQVLSGSGGVGKTQIAARMFTTSRAQLRVWVVAESRTAVLTGYAQAALRLDLADPDAPVEDAAQALLGFLAATKRSWLVVLDDLADPADLTELWPSTRDADNDDAGGGGSAGDGGEARVVVTTRRRDAALSGGGRRVIDVNVYTPEEAVRYLHDRLTPHAGALPAGALDEAAGLAEDLGFLPLALAQAAAVILDQALTLGQYRDRFADRTQTLAQLFPAGTDPDGYTRTVATTWTLAIDTANQLPPNGLAGPLAQLIATLDPAGVPEPVLTSKRVGAYLTASAEADEAGAEASTSETQPAAPSRWPL